MSAFAAAINAIFGDPNIAEDGLWRAGGSGPPQPVRVIRRAPDRVESFGPGRFVTDTSVLELPVAAVPALAEGDTVEVGGALFTVRGEPVRDGLRLVWQAEGRPS